MCFLSNGSGRLPQRALSVSLHAPTGEAQRLSLQPTGCSMVALVDERAKSGVTLLFVLLATQLPCAGGFSNACLAPVHVLACEFMCLAAKNQGPISGRRRLPARFASLGPMSGRGGTAGLRAQRGGREQSLSRGGSGNTRGQRGRGRGGFSTGGGNGGAGTNWRRGVDGGDSLARAVGAKIKFCSRTRARAVRRRPP